jgi:hypothetical protein
MKTKLRTRVKKIETTLKDVATEFGLVNPPLRRPRKGPTDGDERKKAILRNTAQAIGKTRKENKENP